MSALQQILTKNSNTEIGKKWKFKDILSEEEYCKRVPLTTYETYKPYVDRIAEKGEQNLLTSDTIVQFAPSSGTTGKMKLIPVSNEVFVDFPSPSSDEKNLLFGSFPDDRSHTTSHGMFIQAVSVRILRHLLKTYPKNYVAPFHAYDIDSVPVALYVQLVFGLKDRLVNVLSSTFIPLIVTALTELKLKWHQMCTDIETGLFDPCFPISPDARAVLQPILGGPDSVRADELRGLFKQAEESNFKNFVPSIWPNLKMIKCACSGNLKCYFPILKHYIGSEVHISSFAYPCSEGIIGLPARPSEETSLFSLNPSHFYEFIPLSSSGEDQPNTCLSNEVEVGKVYEIVMTTPSGFYRYRNGDYIKVIEQGERGPLIDFHGRRKMSLFLGDHILYEVNMEEAMMAYCEAKKVKVDYIVSVDTSTFNRYRIWMECDDFPRDIAKFIDESLQKVDETYKYDRTHDKLDQLSVSQVQAGTFSKIMAYMKSKTITVEAQLKIPRMVFDNKIDEILRQSLTL